MIDYVRQSGSDAYSRCIHRHMYVGVCIGKYTAHRPGVRRCQNAVLDYLLDRLR